jgi:hypothetical protein
MASLVVKMDIGPFDEFMGDWEQASARLDDVPDYLWERMQRLVEKPGYAARTKFVDGILICEPSPEALSILATLRALSA